MLTASADCLQVMCKEMEEASSKPALQQALRRFNGIVGKFLGLTLLPQSYEELRKAFESLGTSSHLTTFLEASTVLNVAITNYISFIVEQFAVGIRRREDQRRLAHEIDE